jgi:hypothetical protein
LGLFVQDEIDARQPVSMDAGVATQQAAVVARDVNMDDVF